MLFQSWQRLSCTLIVAGYLSVVSSYAQAITPKSQRSDSHATTSVYENEQIKLVIPADWTVVNNTNSRLDQFAEIGASITSAKGKLFLKKAGYTLGIAYETQQTSGITGGRLIEILSIPWPNVDDEQSCSGSLSRVPQPASRELMFVNLIIDSDNPEVRKYCGLKQDLGHWADQDQGESFVGERRWFAGYFTTADDGFFFDSEGTGCGQKAYVLVHWAKTPQEPPIARETELRKTVDQVIDMVDSIKYKRCPPAAAR